MPSPSDTVGRFPRSSFLQILRVSEDSTSPDDEPYIELSTPHVNYAVGGDSRADVAQSWQRVTVVLAALTSAKCNAYALVVCPILDCGLAPNPPTPIVRLILPDDQVLVESCSTVSRVVGVRHWHRGKSIDFLLQFDLDLEFWDFIRIVSEVNTEAEIHRTSLLEQIPLVLDNILSHGPSPGARALCSNESHFSPPAEAAGQLRSEELIS